MNPAGCGSPVAACIHGAKNVAAPGGAKSYRLFALAGAALVVAACAPVPASPSPPSPPTPPVKAADFETAIARFEKDDPGSPETLNMRLQYADFLANAAGPDCAPSLAGAQSQLDLVAARPAIDAVLPLAKAEIAGTQYKIHLARAVCGGEAARERELHQARDAAMKAAGLYRDALDYPSAAIMQFNAAAAAQQLGDADGALSGLEAAIAMDRDYGLVKDGEDNTRLLLEWEGRTADDDAVAAAMKDFPAPAPIDFTFAWSPGDADVAVQVDVTSVIHGKVIESHGTATRKREVRASGNGWTVAGEAGSARYDVGDWPADAKVSEWSILYFMAAALAERPGVEIGKDGDFQSVPDAKDFGTSLAREIYGQIATRVFDPSGGKLQPADAIALYLSPSFSPEGQAVVRTLDPAFTAGIIEAKAQEEYGLQTGTWIGAKLTQGVWYRMSTPLFLPGLGLGLFTAQHEISFAFTRELACAPGSNLRCAEIVMHATPDPGDLRKAFAEADQDLELPDNPSLRYWPRTDLRLVIDPKTLRLYVSDQRQSWYDGVGKSEPIVEQIRTVTTYHYR